MTESQESQRQTAQNGCDSAQASHFWPLVFLLAISALCATAFFKLQASTEYRLDVEVHPALFLFAILGVVFHMASKYRELRDVETFSLGKYWFDHLFRIFQACLYVLIIDNWQNKGDQASISMAVIALFVGMYIRKVEVAFESLGERFGEMLKSLLGLSSQQASQEERAQRVKSLKAELEELQQQATTLTARNAPLAVDKIGRAHV